MKTKKPEIVSATELSVRLSKVREALNLSKAQFAREMDASPTAITELENGKYKPKLDFIIRMTDKFNVNLYYIAFGEEPMFTKSRKDGYEVPDRLFEDSVINIADIERFITDLSNSPYLLYLVYSYYQGAWAEHENTILKDMEKSKAKKANSGSPVSNADKPEK
jgi:transcriptional regulator with XRE-family HTH domain